MKLFYHMLAFAIRIIYVGAEGAAVLNEGYLATALDPAIEGGGIMICSTLANSSSQLRRRL